MENANLSPEQKRAVLLRIFSTDIEEFGKFFFPHHLQLETPEFHREVYKMYESDSLKIALGAPRGHAKSTITDLVYLAWAIVHKKAHFILLVSDTYTQASLFLDGLKAELETNERLKAFYGKLTSNTWSEGDIIANGIMIKAVGAGMKVRGLKYHEFRPDLVVIDDLENDELVESKERREKLERWFNAALIPSMATGGRVVVIGTILHYDSLLFKLLSPDKYKSFFKKTYRAINDWGALWAEHLSLGDLEAIKQDYISQGLGYLFYQEYQNDPITDENRKFKLEKFRYYEEPSVAGLDLKTFIAIDRAYSLQKTADFTALVVVSVDRENNWYVRMAERFKGTERELINKIFDLKGYFAPQTIGIEQKAFQYTLKPTLEDEMRKRDDFFKVVELKDLGQSKNKRIEGIVPRFESGSLFIQRTQTDLIDEMLMFPKAPHDDLIDALAYQLELTNGVAYRPNVARQHIPSQMGIRLRPQLR